MAGQAFVNSAPRLAAALVLWSAVGLSAASLSEPEKVLKGWNVTSSQLATIKPSIMRTADGKTLVFVAVESVEVARRHIAPKLLTRLGEVKLHKGDSDSSHKLILSFFDGQLVFNIQEDEAKQRYTIKEVHGQFNPGGYSDMRCITDPLNVTYSKRYRYSCVGEQKLACYAKSKHTDSGRKELFEIKFKHLEFELMNSRPKQGLRFALPPYSGSCIRKDNQPIGSTSDRLWQLYKQTFGKVYRDSAEDTMRKSIFLKNKRLIRAHNSQPGHKLGVNHLSDKTQAELDRLNGFRLSSDQYDWMMSNFRLNASHPLGHLMVGESGATDTLPERVDWRMIHGRVSQVKDQGDCGSCWAFATTGVLEGQQLVRNISAGGSIIELSEQNLIDCSKQNGGCNGGAMPYALEDIAKEHGIEDEQSYPYEAMNDQCRYKPDKSVMSDSGYRLLEPTELALQKAVAEFGPVAVAINSRELHYYKSGVYTDPNCKPDVKTLNHAVLVVGYGTDPQQGDYWLIKNSWSFMWGEEGFFRMARNKGNQCGIALFPTIPTF